MVSRWSPPNELNKIGTIIYTGHILGTVFYIGLSGYISRHLTWEYIFYITGGTSMLWLLLWAIFAYDSPQENIFIGEWEKDYITTTLKYVQISKRISAQQVPWGSIIQSSPFWAILVAQTCSNWGWYMILIELPLFLKTTLNLKVSYSGLVSSAMIVLTWIFAMSLSIIMDKLYKYRKISKTNLRKVSNFIASFIPMMCCIGMTFGICRKVLTLSLLLIMITTMGGIYVGHMLNHIDIASNYAGILISLTNTIATLPGILIPIFIGKLSMDEGGMTLQCWKIVFYSCAVFYFVETVAYMFFASGETEEWNVLM